jgi:subfamily B ATP-binding cassette protein HlyB/CyaB
VRVEEGELVYVSFDNAIHRLPLKEFDAQFEPTVLLAAAAPEEVERDERPQFGFRWFLPELARHRGIWRDVLLASAALQIVGLATPLFTQVVIDKVVVHQTQSTLMAIAAGLASSSCSTRR